MLMATEAGVCAILNTFLPLFLPAIIGKGAKNLILEVCEGLTVELEFVIVEFMISSLRGHHPP
jgi:hypothetical protein